MPQFSSLPLTRQNNSRGSAKRLWFAATPCSHKASTGGPKLRLSNLTVTSVTQPRPKPLLLCMVLLLLSRVVVGRVAVRLKTCCCPALCLSVLCFPRLSGPARRAAGSRMKRAWGFWQSGIQAAARRVETQTSQLQGSARFSPHRLGSSGCRGEQQTLDSYLRPKPFNYLTRQTCWSLSTSHSDFCGGGWRARGWRCFRNLLRP